MTISPRLATLVGRLTLEEKASMCLGADFWHTHPIPRLGVPAILLSDGPHGIRTQPEGSDHVGLSGSLAATCFPTACALASSWDVDLVHRVGQALGVEARALGVSVLLGPGINIKRSPLCGRNFEYFSEDPVLSGDLGTAMVDGIQSQGVGASVKHYAANNQETDRLRVSADVDERTLREIYLSAFERVVTRADPWTVMCSYNRVNGIHASQNTWLLTTVLREEWGFNGLVVSDWGAVHDRVAALVAGLDLEMPPNLGVSDAQIVEAVKTGDLDEAILDAAVTRILTLVDRAATTADTTAGETADTTAGAPREWLGPDPHHELAREAARDSAVLLKNEDRILPLTPAPGTAIAVIGEFARTPRYQGAGSSQVNPTRLDIALDEIRAAVADGVEVTFGAGFGVDRTVDHSGDSTVDHSGDSTVDHSGDSTVDDERLAAEAVDLARSADTVVVFLGLPPSAESEGFDRRHMDLPTNQTELLPRLAAVNPRIVVVLANGSAVALADWQHEALAVLECWLSGQGSGKAVADLLLGDANPSGKLAETLPLRLEDNPSYLTFPGDSGHVRYGEGIFVGYRGYDASHREVAYPFGHGLSYSTFAYGDLSVDVQGSHEAGDLQVNLSARVTNTSDRAGKEVVQLYVWDVAASVARPVRELKAFAKVDLDPGASILVSFTLDSRDLSFWSTLTGGWALEAGQFELAVGASSRDLRLTATIDIDAPRNAGPLTLGSTLREWLDDPDGSVALRSAIGTDERGAPRGILNDPDLMNVIGNFPVGSLAAFPGLGVDQATLRAIVD